MNFGIIELELRMPDLPVLDLLVIYKLKQIEQQHIFHPEKDSLMNFHLNLKRLEQLVIIFSHQLVFIR